VHQREINFGKHVVCDFAGEIKWMLSPATPLQIQDVTSNSKTTPLGTTRRLVQLWHCFGTTKPKGLMFNGGRDGSIAYFAVNLWFCYRDYCLIKKMLWYVYE
jgi:hypothetical protein